MTKLQHNQPKEECGIIGIYDKDNLDTANMAYFGLMVMQHRGQESAGIAISNGGFITIYKDAGLVLDIFEDRILNILKGDMCLGHVKYGNAKGKPANLAQPHMTEYRNGNIAVALNGALTNAEELANELGMPVSSSDASIIGQLISRNFRGNMLSAVEKAVSKLKGGFALGILADSKLFGVRDCNGIRPLVIGKLQNGYVLASETVALDILGAEFISEIECGQIACIDYNGVVYNNKATGSKGAICAFEFVYFARPDSNINGLSIYQARENAGIILAQENKIDADCVIGVPDSGTAAAVGYSKGSGIPYCMGLIKNRYVGRTFIQPTQAIRELSVKLKLNPIKENVSGKRVVLIDDSIVRGTTCVKIIELLRRAGAKEIHMMVSSPPVTELCPYGGIDIYDRKELISNQHSKDEICKIIGADSLNYITKEGLLKALSTGEGGYCMGCIGGDYPNCGQDAEA